MLLPTISLYARCSRKAQIEVTFLLLKTNIAIALENHEQDHGGVTNKPSISRGT